MRELTAVVLASASPRRLELLRAVGLEVRVQPSGIREDDRSDLAPADMAMHYASAKAEAVYPHVPAEFVVAADTVVDLDGISLGKPADAAEARRMLRALAGRDHVVHTAYAVRSGDLTLDALSTARVRLAPPDDALIDAYVAGREPFDKAGGYGVQGRGAELIEQIDGDFYTVMGFPLGDFLRRLRRADIRLPACPVSAAA